MYVVFSTAVSLNHSEVIAVLSDSGLPGFNRMTEMFVSQTAESVKKKKIYGGKSS